MQHARVAWVQTSKLHVSSCSFASAHYMDQGLRVNSSAETEMTCMGDYGIKLPKNKKFIEQNKSRYTNGSIENGLMYLV